MKKNKFFPLSGIASLLLVILLGYPALGYGAVTAEYLDLTSHPIGFAALAIFFVAYIFVMLEEVTHLRKSKPVLMAAGLIWGLIGLIYSSNGISHIAEEAIRHNILEYAELLLFLLVAMTYINAMQERLVFESLRVKLVSAGFSLRKLFWITGGLAFVISPVADNLTTALLMCAVVTAIARENKKYICIACVNIVVAANAGGAFSPFGDITTLMVWQKGVLQFNEFVALLVPSLVNWVIPALIMSFTISKMNPEPARDIIKVKRGGLVIIGLFLWTIITAVCFHNFFQLPPMVGMMAGLALLELYSYYLSRTAVKDAPELNDNNGEFFGRIVSFDIFRKVARAEWDTLFFFYGIILCVGGLALMGYLSMLSEAVYIQLGPMTANILVGIISAIVDNIPVMFAVLTMMPDMSTGHWLLVTLTAGVGGSLLSIGSAAGVALMGQARGKYTFFGHLKWSPVIMLGYVASIWVHIILNSNSF